MVPKGSERGLEEWEIGGRIETIQTAAFKIGQNTEKDPKDLNRLAIDSDFSERPLANVGVKILQ